MKKIAATFMYVLSFVLIANACINEYYYFTDKEGHLHTTVGHSPHYPFRTNFSKVDEEERMHSLLQRLIVERSFVALSDYAVCMMKLGKSREAMEVLKSLYETYPGEYQLASNLGTAYELNGQNDSALKYIKRGMELYPGEHEGSEWVHVKILEAKIRQENDPEYISKHSILSLTKEQLNDAVLGKQIRLQLQERFPFCPGPDPVMAQLMTDLADITVNTGSLQLAHGYYELSIQHFGDSSETVLAKYAACKALLEKYEKEGEGKEKDKKSRDGSIVSPMNGKNLIVKYGEGASVDWSRLPTDPAVLLEYLDTTITVEKAHEMIAADPSLEAAQKEPVEADVPVNKAKIWICLALFLVLGGGYALSLRMEE